MTTHDIDIELPPLPEWMCKFQIPTDDQDDSDFNWLDWRMKEYARAAVLADRASRAAQAEAVAGDAQPVAAQDAYPQMMPADLSQFLSDVMTAAGLVSHGKQCKALGERLGDACMRLRLHYQELFAAPQPPEAAPVQMPEPEWWINYCAATGKETASRIQESELASAPLYTEHQVRQLLAAHAHGITQEKQG